MNTSGRRRRRYDGRYTYVSSEFWRDAEVQALTRDARHLLLCLMTGTLSNQAGIFALNLEAITRDFASRGDVGLTRAHVETLLVELEKCPSPARSFIVRDADALWIRNQLRDDRAKHSENTLKGIRWDLSRVPRTSRVVRQFRKYYAYILEEGAWQGAGEAPSQAAGPVPENPSPSGEKRIRTLPEIAARATSREPRQPTPSPAERASAGSGTGEESNPLGPIVQTLAESARLEPSSGPSRGSTKDAADRAAVRAVLEDFERRYPDDVANKGRNPSSSRGKDHHPADDGQRAEELL